jgi:uncharacterized RDD family membrane protein YckC
MDDFKALKKRADRIQKAGIDDKYRTLGRRFYAGLVDMTILMLVEIVLEVGLLLVSVEYRYPIWQLVSLPLNLVYPIVTTKLWGGTPGKLYFNLVVRTARGEAPISWWQSVVREAISIVSNLVNWGSVYYFYFILGLTSYSQFSNFTSHSLFLQGFTVLASAVFFVELATANASATRRSVHDFLAGTVVLKTGPYRPWSNFLAIGATIVVLIVQFSFFRFVHN